MTHPNTLKSSSDKSKHFVHNARAIGIFFVVFGHTPGIPVGVHNFIYAFHMPLFFFLSGYLLSDNKLNAAAGEFSTSQAKKLLIPYLFFGILSWLYWTATKSIPQKTFTDKSSGTFHTLLNLFYGTSDRLFFNIPLWFFPCIFLVTVLYHIIFKIYLKLTNRYLSYSGAKYSLAFVLLLSGGFVAYFLRLEEYIWSCDVAIVALFFYACGAALGKIEIDKLVKRNSRAAILVSMACFFLVAYVSVQNGRVDMSGMDYGNVFLFYSGACVGILGVIVLCCLIPSSAIFRYLSNNTIVIFPIHGMMFGIITAVLIFGFKLSVSVKNNPYVSLGYAIAALAATYPAAVILRRYFPFAIGASAERK